MSADYDVVIVGGGHNGLTAAAYLAKDSLQDSGTPLDLAQLVSKSGK